MGHLGFLLATVIVARATIDQKQFVGVYECLTVSNGQALSNADIPAPRVRWLELHTGGNWELRDSMTGFDGTWRVSGKQIVLLASNGPAGKLKSPQKWVLTPKPDKRRLVPTSPAAIVGQIEFRFAPKLKQDLSKRLKSS